MACSDSIPSRAQLLFQRRDVGAEVGEVTNHRQGVVGGHEDPVGLAAVAILHREDLCEGDGRVVAEVGEHAQDHREGAGVA